MNSTEGNRSSATRRWRLTLAYDGTDFHGWQSQPTGKTVQDFLEKRLATIFKEPIRVHGSGRTDSGVHARAQVAHFDANWNHPPERLLAALRSGLPEGIMPLDLRTVPAGFHARYSARAKRYVYHLHQGMADPFEGRFCHSLGGRELDLADMRKAARTFLGEHDFTAFAADRGDGSDENPVKQLWRVEVIERPPRVRIIFEGSGFLYKMARSLTGALLDVGLGKLPAAEIPSILASRKRTARVFTAPARGLFLEHVYYHRLPASARSASTRKDSPRKASAGKETPDV